MVLSLLWVGLNAVGAGPVSNWVFIIPTFVRLKLNVESMLSMYNKICVPFAQSSTKQHAGYLLVTIQILLPY